MILSPYTSVMVVSSAPASMPRIQRNCKEEEVRVSLLSWFFISSLFSYTFCFFISFYLSFSQSPQVLSWDLSSAELPEARFGFKTHWCFAPCFFSCLSIEICWHFKRNKPFLFFWSLESVFHCYKISSVERDYIQTICAPSPYERDSRVWRLSSVLGQPLLLVGLDQVASIIRGFCSKLLES